MRTRSVPILKIAVVVLSLLLVGAVWLIARLGMWGGSMSIAGNDSAATDVAVAPRDTATEEQAGGAADGAELDQQVRYSSLDIEVPEIRAAMDSIRAAVEDFDGSIESAQTSTGGWEQPIPLQDRGSAESAPTAGWATVLVPDQRLEDFLAEMRQLGHVTSESTSTQDVTTQYEDLGARIPILEAEQGALTAMLARATTVEDELKVRDRLVTVTADLESLRAQLASLEKQDAMATVSISLTVPASQRSTSDVSLPWFSGYQFQQALASGLAALMWIVYATVTVLIAAVPVLVILAVVLLVRRRRSRRESGRESGREDGPIDAPPLD